MEYSIYRLLLQSKIPLLHNLDFVWYLVGKGELVILVQIINKNYGSYRKYRKAMESWKCIEQDQDSVPLRRRPRWILSTLLAVDKMCKMVCFHNFSCLLFINRVQLFFWLPLQCNVQLTMCALIRPESFWVQASQIATPICRCVPGASTWRRATTSPFTLSSSRLRGSLTSWKSLTVAFPDTRPTDRVPSHNITVV